MNAVSANAGGVFGFGGDFGEEFFWNGDGFAPAGALVELVGAELAIVRFAAERAFGGVDHAGVGCSLRW